MVCLAKERKVDVVLFVVNAENHFTQSARDFLNQAAKEKQYVFLVVNKFDNIRKKELNQMEILNQLKLISPTTFEHSDELVHFVSAKLAQSEELEWTRSFAEMEHALFNFVLKKRIVSKLAPAKSYLQNIIGGITSFCNKELDICRQEIDALQQVITFRQPYLDNLKVFKSTFLDNMDDVVQELGDIIENNTKQRLESFVNGNQLFTFRV